MERKKWFVAYRQTYCLFDVCCLAKAKNESFQEIGLRIANHMNNSYRILLEKGFCKCHTCMPLRFRSGGIWILNDKLTQTEHEVIYIVCRDFFEDRLNNFQTTQYMQLSVSNNCKSRDSFKPKYKNLYPCCFNFYKTCLISVINFCTSCKVFFASLPDFHLKKSSYG